MSVATGSIQAAFCATLIDELERAGVTDAVVSPGSRSTPLALAIAGSSLRMHVRLDERSACFVAVGLARTTQRPVLVLVTSGTAAAELLAGVVEAQLDRVPLIVATADRPPELHGIGAAQTIEQRGIFGPHVLSAIDPGPVHALPPSSWRPIASRLVHDALTGPCAGPVAINLPFVEPLVAEPGPVPPGRSGGRPWYSTAPGAKTSAVELAVGGRGVIVAGQGAGSSDLVLGAARRLGWPVLADPRSGLSSSDPCVVTVADTIVRDDRLAATMRPETILIAGAPPASKVLAGWIDDAAAAGAELVLLGGDGLHRHPSQLAALVVPGPADHCWPRLRPGGVPDDPSWLGRWSALQGAIDSTFAQALDDPAWNEPAVVRTIAQLDAASTIVASSSMPIRDLEWFGGTRPRPPVIHANRGANGIDGVVSTAMGVALGSPGPVVAIVGDLAFLHDVSSLVEGLGEGDQGSLTIVVLDNGGGGIFSFLPQRSSVPAEAFARLFTTQRSPRPEAVAAGFGLRSHVVADAGSLRTRLAESVGSAGISVIVCQLPDHDSNVEVHARLVADAVAAARAAVGV